MRQMKTAEQSGTHNVNEIGRGSTTDGSTFSGGTRNFSRTLIGSILSFNLDVEASAASSSSAFLPIIADCRTDGRSGQLKHQLRDRAPKTVNNVLTVLNVLLKKAVEWDVIQRMPCAIRLLPIPKGSAGFYDFDEYERLVAAANATDRSAHLVVLLGGEAGLRCREIMTLEWSDVDLGKRQLCVQRSDWKGHVTATKGGRIRYVPLTLRLAAALREHRHLRGARVLCQRDGSPFTQKIVQDHVRRSVRRAQLAKSGVHRLRHTFCSHLVMRGAPARAIQELAGYHGLPTTRRYMHLSPAALDAVIRWLETGPDASRSAVACQP
jgi:integrase